MRLSSLLVIIGSAFALEGCEVCKTFLGKAEAEFKANKVTDAAAVEKDCNQIFSLKRF